LNIDVYFLFNTTLCICCQQLQIVLMIGFMGAGLHTVCLSLPHLWATDSRTESHRQWV